MDTGRRFVKGKCLKVDMDSNELLGYVHIELDEEFRGHDRCMFEFIKSEHAPAVGDTITANVEFVDDLIYGVDDFAIVSN